MRVTAAVPLCLLLFACGRLPFTVSAEESATRVCEERLKDDLKSPSSYRRVWSAFTPGAPTSRKDEIDKYEADRLDAVHSGNDGAAITSALIVRCLREGDKHPTATCSDILKYGQGRKTAYVLIEYEAANSFNAQLQGFYTCRMTARDDGKYAAASVFSSTPLSLADGKRLKSIARPT